MAPQRRTTNTGWIGFYGSLLAALLVNAALITHLGVDDAPHGVTWLVAVSIGALAVSVVVDVPSLLSKAYDELLQTGDARRYPGLVTEWLARELLEMVARAAWFAVLVASTFSILRQVDEWWLPGFVVATAITLVRTLAAPFDPSLRFTTEPASEEVRSRVEDVARRAGAEVREVRVHRMIPGLRHSLASICGVGRRSLIALSPAIAESGPDIVIPVVSHELGHRRRGAWQRAIARSAFVGAITIGALQVVSTVGDPGVDGSPYAIAAFAFCLIAGRNLLGPMYAWFSRREELAADVYGARLVGDADAYAKVLGLLENEGGDGSTNSDVVFGQSHPPIARRIEAVRALLPRSGPATWT